MLTHAVTIHVCTSLNPIIEWKPRCTFLTFRLKCISVYWTISRFSPISSQTHWGREICRRPSGELWCLQQSCVGDTMVYHCTSDVCVAFLWQHWRKWWCAACSVPGHHLSQYWYAVNRIPGWMLRFLSKTQKSSCRNAFQMLPANGGLSVAASMSHCHEIRHKGIRVWLLAL